MRAAEIQTAGPAALLVAKLHKLADRANGPGNPRLQNKDAFDIYRIFVATHAPELTEEMAVLVRDGRSQAITKEAWSDFQELFGRDSAAGTQLVVDHVETLADPEFIAASVVALGEEFLGGVVKIIWPKLPVPGFGNLPGRTLRF